MRYICSVCGYIYDEEKEKIPFAELPEDWKCPLCGAAKSDFVPEGQSAGSTAAPAAPAAETDLKPLTAAEVSALCSNLAKGCEKQYRAELAEAFMVLAAWFGGRERTVTDASFEQLLERVNADLDSGFPVEREGDAHPQIPADPVRAGRGSDAGGYAGVCLHDLRFRLCGERSSRSLPGLQGAEL